MTNVCNPGTSKYPQGRFFLAEDCLLECYYKLANVKDVKKPENEKCFSGISEKVVMPANYTDNTFQQTVTYAWVMGSLNILVLLLFLCWFNIPNYKRILNRSSKLDEPRWKQIVDYIYERFLTLRFGKQSKF